MPNSFKLEWDIQGTRFFQTGTNRGVLYPMAADGSYPKGEVWNGLTGVDHQGLHFPRWLLCLQRAGYSE